MIGEIFVGHDAAIERDDKDLALKTRDVFQDAAQVGGFDVSPLLISVSFNRASRRARQWGFVGGSSRGRTVANCIGGFLYPFARLAAKKRAAWQGNRTFSGS